MNSEKYYNTLSTGSFVPDEKQKKNLSDLKTYFIFIKKLVLDVFIGIHPHEKKSKQKISIDITLQVPDNLSKIEDDISKVVSYEKIVEEIKQIFKKGHVGLLETVSEDIAQICLKDHRVINATIEIEKLEVFSETESVGIKIFREQTKSRLFNDKKIYNLKK